MSRTAGVAKQLLETDERTVHCSLGSTAPVFPVSPVSLKTNGVLRVICPTCSEKKREGVQEAALEAAEKRGVSVDQKEC